MTSVPHSGAKSVTPGGSVAGGHTKGTWHIDGDTVVSFDGAIVVWELNSNDADAALITAAPDLLDALRDLLGNAEIARFHIQGTEEGMLIGSALFDTINQAREAIAKATAGETRNAEPIHRRDGDAESGGVNHNAPEGQA
ncbi:hypothetical protein HNP32_003464 [Brevundimonas bullata]|uniref:Uncharacterized protein n=1 Tax=Brevundimonas bullata TaxID=13160 RepID=A0A7W7ISG0_9CAUL|nr:hypothetical protein [Brevundimonas bullata]MBB4799704.1 hypothetical protein [Brevundimonas bullata]MBB6384674.1 hypothetical protein [Brevundimonas bullata]